MRSNLRAKRNARNRQRLGDALPELLRQKALRDSDPSPAARAERKRKAEIAESARAENRARGVLRAAKEAKKKETARQRDFRATPLEVRVLINIADGILECQDAAIHSSTPEAVRLFAASDGGPLRFARDLSDHEARAIQEACWAWIAEPKDHEAKAEEVAGQYMRIVESRLWAAKERALGGCSGLGYLGQKYDRPWFGWMDAISRLVKERIRNTTRCDVCPACGVPTEGQPQGRRTRGRAFLEQVPARHSVLVSLAESLIEDSEANGLRLVSADDTRRGELGSLRTEEAEAVRRVVNDWIECQPVANTADDLYQIVERPLLALSDQRAAVAVENESHGFVWNAFAGTPSGPAWFSSMMDRDGAEEDAARLGISICRGYQKWTDRDAAAGCRPSSRVQWIHILKTYRAWLGAQADA